MWPALSTLAVYGATAAATLRLAHRLACALVLSTLLGFEVPAGRHEAVLRYQPDGYRYGAAISGATLLVLGVSLLAGRARAARGQRG